MHGMWTPSLEKVNLLFFLSDLTLYQRLKKESCKMIEVILDIIQHQYIKIKSLKIKIHKTCLHSNVHKSARERL